MALPAPNLDDRRFQELVDDAKRYVMRRCPEWTDHNVSDPGVTLIETFAYMTDLMLYRLNRVPDRLYVKFLELIGLRLFPATPARAATTFWLSAPAQAPMTISANTRVSTLRTETEDAIVFSTVEDLGIVACELWSIGTQAKDAEHKIDRTERMRLGEPFSAFSPAPVVGDLLMVGLSEAVPSNCVRLAFRCTIEGVGVDPDFPPLVWEAWSGAAWEECEVSTDQTGGLNRDGYIDVHVPRTHTVSIIDEQRAGWLRARVVAPVEGQPAYSATPLIHGLVAGTVGGTVDAIHAELVEREVMGESEGVPGQRFMVHRIPVAASSDIRLEVSADDGWEEWTEVQHFAESGDTDHHYIFDPVAGEVRFGPAVRELNGTIRQHGAVPPKGVFVQMRSYATGGGRLGNVSRGSLQTLRSSIPYVAAVENRRPATGGVDAETIESAKDRGPIVLRTRSRAVTAEDFEFLTREAAPEIARVRCIAAGSGPEAGTVKVLAVPAAPQQQARIRFEDLVPSVETLERIRERLDRSRLVGTRVLIEPPTYQGVTIVATVRARPRASASRIREEAVARLHEYFNPLVGGPDGAGWPWGRPVQAGEAYSVLQSINGVDIVEDLRLYGANPVTGQRGSATTKVDLPPGSLVFSYEHQIRVVEGG